MGADARDPFRQTANSDTTAHDAPPVRARDSSPFVGIHDPSDARRAMVRGVVAGLDLPPLDLPEPGGPAHSSSTAGFLAVLMALTETQARDAVVVEWIAQTRRRGVRTICYGHKTSSWGVGLHAGLLLSGADALLDVSDAGFPERLRNRLLRVLNVRRDGQKKAIEIDQAMRETGLVGSSEALRSLVERVLRISRLSDLAVLITGETGTGKELFARAIWKLDRGRKDRPFVAVNCAALVPTLMETELFGHESGVFTGADRRRRGLIRAADGGVLFLDEVAELDLGLQAKVLRVLQDHRVRGVGQEHEERVDIRVIAATHRDLVEEVRRGRFRDDLFHRLHVIGLRIPPLRERPSDIAPLALHFLAQATGRSAPPAELMDPPILAALERLAFPGNVRQLENLIRGVVLEREHDEPIGLADLPEEAWRELVERELTAPSAPDDGTARPPQGSSEGSVFSTDLHSALLRLLEARRWKLTEAMQACEAICLRAALEQAGGNQSQAARLLGITSRSVYNKIRRHHVRTS